MTNKIYHKRSVHPIFFLISSLFVLVSIKTTIATSLSHQPAGGNSKCIETERRALLRFKSYIQLDAFGFLSSWTHKENDCCEWNGVTCNNQTGHVTSLDLSFEYLQGTVSPSLVNLTYLNHLNLSHNYFDGTILMFISSMTQLRSLDLYENSFNGTIPESIGSLTKLRYLNLGVNLLTRTIPGSIGSLTELRYLNLGDNFLTGTIPGSIGSLTELRFLDLQLNDFIGTVPQLGNLINLQVLSLGTKYIENQESHGTLSIENLEWLSHLSHLETLDMTGTSLAKVDNWVNVILSLKKLSSLWLLSCDLSQVIHPYSYSSANSSFSSPIIHLDLGYNNLNSSMYSWLFPLTSNRLEELYLSGNKLDDIPKYVGNLCSLRNLDFSNNSLRVKFPDFMYNLSGCASVTLEELYAPDNQFTGSLMDDIQKFSSLQYLYLQNNQLNGTISEKVWQLPKLQVLDISSNSLKGEISKNIGETKILAVDLSNNSLEGVPSEVQMSNLSDVQEIDLSSCKLGPHFPKWIQKLKNLTLLNFPKTGISDRVPVEFWNMWPSQLNYLNLSSNNLYGSIPNVSSSLQSLDLSQNKFYGKIFFLCQIVDGYLSFLDLSNNSFIGEIPNCLWHFKELKVLSLGHNNLSGRLPASIEYLINLEVLNLYNNNFSGELPVSLKNCTRLTFLEFGANKFSGHLPIWIGEGLPRLYGLSMTSNNFTGTIPLQLCQLVYLNMLDLSMNKLYGTIPSCLNNISALIHDGSDTYQNQHNYNGSSLYIDHAMIMWQGSVREFSKNLGMLKSIDLSNNILTGQIPNELTDLLALMQLNLSNNALYGEIPYEIGKMKGLQILDLSGNQFSGGMPSSMSQINFLNYLDVSYNNLSGRIPVGTQLQSFEPSRYTGNGLCGPPLPNIAREIKS